MTSAGPTLADTFFCEPWGTKLLPAACARRHQLAKGTGAEAMRMSRCRDCPIGRDNEAKYGKEIAMRLPVGATGRMGATRKSSPPSVEIVPENYAPESYEPSGQTCAVLGLDSHGRVPEPDPVDDNVKVGVGGKLIELLRARPWITTHEIRTALGWQGNTTHTELGRRRRVGAIIAIGRHGERRYALPDTPPPPDVSRRKSKPKHVSIEVPKIESADGLAILPTERDRKWLDRHYELAGLAVRVEVAREEANYASDKYAILKLEYQKALESLVKEGMNR